MRRVSKFGSSISDGIVFAIISPSISQAPVVQKVDNAICRINHYPLDSAVDFPNSYPLDSDLSGG